MIFQRNVELSGRDCREVAKSQQLRTVDVLLLGPFMIWYGARNYRGDVASLAMIVGGILTIVYNFSNYVATRERNA